MDPATYYRLVHRAGPFIVLRNVHTGNLDLFRWTRNRRYHLTWGGGRARFVCPLVGVLDIDHYDQSHMPQKGRES